VDVDFTPSPSTCGSGISGAPPEKAMTFTVGRTGTLTRVDLVLERGPDAGSGDVVFELRDTVLGAPDPDDASVLTSIVLDAEDWPASEGLVSVDVTALSLAVVAGDVYAIVLRAPGAGAVGGWLGADVSAHAGGDGFYRDPAVSGDFVRMSCDHSFRTHVEP
jgi:hypothetical protein